MSSSAVLAELWRADDSEYGEIAGELLTLVDEGLLRMGVNDSGEMTFWATEKGCEVLGMEALAVA